MKKLITISILFLATSLSCFSQGHRCWEDLFPVKHEKNRLYGYKNMLGMWRINPTFTIGYPFRGNVAIVLVGKKYGAVSCEGKMVIQPEYDEIKEFIGGRAWARKGDLWGLLSDEGTVVINPEYSEVIDISRFRSQSWVKKGGKWALFNRDSGKLMTELIYDSYKTLIDSTSIVKTDKYYGLISHNSGKYLIDPNLEQISRIAPYTLKFKRGGLWGLADDFGRIRVKPIYDSITAKYRFRLQVSKDGKHGLVNLKGRTIAGVKYDEIDQFYENVVRVKKDGKYGFITFKGRIAIPIEYDYAERFKNFRCIVKKNEDFGVINSKNQFLIDKQYRSIKRDYNNNFYVVESDTAKHLFDIKGRLISKITFEEIEYADQPDFIRVKLEEKWGMYSVNSNEFRIPNKYKSLTSIDVGFSMYQNNNMYGIVDSLGNEIVNNEYDEIIFKRFGSKTYFQLKKASKYGYANNVGEIVIPDEYDNIIRSDKATLKVIKDGKYGILSSSSNSFGKIIAELDFDYISNSQEDFGGYPAITKVKGKYGLYTMKGNQFIELLPNKYKNGKSIGGNLFAFKKGKKYALTNYLGHFKTEFEYDEFGMFSEKLIAVKKGSVWGYININGKENINPRFESATEFIESIACVKESGKWGIIGRNGKYIVNPKYIDYKLDSGNERYFLSDQNIWLSLNSILEK